MRAPEFWSRERLGIPAALLFPVGLIYDLAVKLRFRTARPEKMPIPIVCVGNFVTGGAGKTPTALAIAKLLLEAGKTPFFLSRGYGGKETGPIRVDPETATARQFGDEPLLLAKVAPTIVSANRPDGALLGTDSGSGIIIMDDGLQNPSLKKSISFAVLDGYEGIGNGAVFPAGPLRAGLDFQLGLIDAVIVIGESIRSIETVKRAGEREIPVFCGSLEPASSTIKVKNRKVAAYAGIGHPEKFFRTLEHAGAKLVVSRSFPDHYIFSAKDAQQLLATAKQHKACLVTTEKDYVRLAGQDHLAELQSATQSFDINLRFENPDAIMNLIEQKCKI